MCCCQMQIHKYKYKYTKLPLHKYRNTNKPEPNQTALLRVQVIYVLLPNTKGCFSNTALVLLNPCQFLEINTFFFKRSCISQRMVYFQTGVNCVKISCPASQLLARALLIISGWYRVIKRPSKGKPTKGVIYELGLSPDDSKSFQL